MKKSEITLIWEYKTVGPDPDTFYISAYQSDKLYPQHSDVGFIAPKDNGKFYVHVQTNTGWDKEEAETLESAKQKFVEMYQSYRNRYEYHLASLFTTYKVREITVKAA